MATRKRKNKIVEIPEEWLNKVTHPQTIRKRRSKQNAQIRRNVVSHPCKDGTWPTIQYLRSKNE
jgi:hypothetical protein